LAACHFHRVACPLSDRDTVCADAMRWFDDETNPTPFLMALEEVRRLATREGWCYHHVQAIIVAIDQYAEAALGNRDFFLNKPYSTVPGKAYFVILRLYGPAETAINKSWKPSDIKAMN
jgi:hypothetical protein